MANTVNTISGYIKSSSSTETIPDSTSKKIPVPTLREILVSSTSTEPVPVLTTRKILVSPTSTAPIPVHSTAPIPVHSTERIRNRTSQEITQQAEDYFQKKKPGKAPFISTNKPPKNAQEAFDLLLDYFDGICLGGRYDQNTSQSVLEKNMKFLSEKGVTSLFVEEVSLKDIKKVERFNSGLSNDVSWAHPNSENVIRIARSHGIRIYPIDCNRGNPDVGYVKLLNLNYATCLAVQEAREKNPQMGKYIVWVGARHTNDCYCYPDLDNNDDYIGDQPKEVPGISEILNIPSMLCMDKSGYRSLGYTSPPDTDFLKSCEMNAWHTSAGSQSRVNVLLLESSSDTIPVSTKTIPVHSNETIPVHSTERIRYRTSQEITQQAEDFFQMEKPGKAPVISTSKSPKNAQEAFDLLLDDFDGVCLGEVHDQMASKAVLEKNMKYLKKKGVTSLFVEGVCLSKIDEIERFNSGLSNDVSWAHPDSQKVIRIARSHGIRIHPIDYDHNNPDESYERLLNLNYATCLAVKEARAKDSQMGKYIVWVGARHTNNYHPPKKNNDYSGDQPKEVPGISEILNIPSMVCVDKSRYWCLGYTAPPGDCCEMNRCHPFSKRFDSRINVLLHE